MNSLKNCSNDYKVGVGIRIVLSKNLPAILISFGILLLVSCGSHEARNYSEKSKAIADSVSSYVPGIATDTINGITHNFIRTADVKCKVKDVLNSTRKIEQITNSVGGYITKSDLNSNKDYTDNIRFKKDSLIELTHYTSTSNIILRIPNKQLDTVLDKITEMAEFVDFRTIHCDDVKLKLYANQLTEKRNEHYKKRMQNNIDKKGAKLNQITDAEENVLAKETISDNKSVESYELADQVNYSTVTLSFYQSQNTISDKKVLPANIEIYKPSFLSKLGDAFINGFEMLKEVVLFFVNIWGLILILLALFLVIKKIINHYSKSNPALASDQGRTR